MNSDPGEYRFLPWCFWTVPHSGGYADTPFMGSPPAGSAYFYDSFILLSNSSSRSAKRYFS